MQLELRHAAERNAKRYRENLSYLRGYEAAADAGRPLPSKYVEKAGWVWAVERVRADLKAKSPEKERFFARFYHLDEPVSGLDPKMTAEMYDLIDSLHREGITVIMITHDIAAAIRYATKILHIGEPFFFGTKEEFCHSRAVAEKLGPFAQHTIDHLHNSHGHCPLGANCKECRHD